jgi:rubredoxin
MKIIVSLLVLVLATTALASENSTQSEIETGNSTSPPVPGGSHFGNASEDQICMECRSNMKKLFIDISNVINITSNANFGKVVILNFQSCDPKFLDVFKMVCVQYPAINKCIQACEDGKTKQAIQPALELAKSICVDHFENLLQHYTCKMSMCDKIDSVCEPKCKVEKESFENILNKTLQDNSSFGDMADQVCKNIDCSNKCANPIVASKCTTEGVALEQEILKKMVNSTEHFLLHSDELVAITLPDSCKKLGSGVTTIQASMPLFFALIMIFILKGF